VRIYTISSAVIGVLVAAQATFASTAPTHCELGETDYFSCRIKGTNKVASLCGSAIFEADSGERSRNAWLEYRFGRLSRIEFRFPSTRTASLESFVGEHVHTHEDGNRLPSTISYIVRAVHCPSEENIPRGVCIEISKGTLAGRWPKRFFHNITRDYTHKGEASTGAGLQELADRDKNFSFYSRLIQEHGPLRVWYATLDELNAAAKKANLSERTTVREWERHLIKSYRGIHGCQRRPLKNRQD